MTVLGHSLGGVIALAAALRSPGEVVGLLTFETPMRWLLEGEPDWWEPAEDPATEAERFFRRITSDASWERLSEQERASRQADGAALAADLRMVREPAPFFAEDLADLEIPICLALGSGGDQTRYARAAAVVVANAQKAWIAEVPGAQHGAHLTHPDGLAGLVRELVRLETTMELSR